MSYPNYFRIDQLHMALSSLSALEFDVRLSTKVRDHPEVLVVTAAASNQIAEWMFYPLFSGGYVMEAPGSTVTCDTFDEGLDALIRSAMSCTAPGFRVLLRPSQSNLPAK